VVEVWPKGQEPGKRPGSPRSTDKGASPPKRRKPGSPEKEHEFALPSRPTRTSRARKDGSDNVNDRPRFVCFVFTKNYEFFVLFRGPLDCCVENLNRSIAIKWTPMTIDLYI